MIVLYFEPLEILENHFSQQILDNPNSQTETTKLGREAERIINKTFIATARSRLAQMARISDETTRRMANISLVNAYLDSPKITIFQSNAAVFDDESIALRYAIDLRKNDIRTVVAPGQNPAVKFAFNTNRGFTDTLFESRVLGGFETSGDANLQTEISAFSVIDTAIQQGINLVLITDSNKSMLEVLDISADAKAYITQAITHGKVVFVPSRSVSINNEPRVAWYETDASSGETIGVLDTGGHQSTVESVAARYESWIMTRSGEFGLGMIAGLGVGKLFNLIKFLGFVVVSNTPGSLGLNEQILKWKNLIGYSLPNSDPHIGYAGDT